MVKDLEVKVSHNIRTGDYFYSGTLFVYLEVTEE
jgi:hypothetical protein